MNGSFVKVVPRIISYPSSLSALDIVEEIRPKGGRNSFEKKEGGLGELGGLSEA